MTDFYNAFEELLGKKKISLWASKTAIIDEAGSYTYDELNQYAQQCAHFLSVIGVKKGQRILLAITDRVEFHVCFLGAIKAGVIPVPVNTLLNEKEYRFIIDDSEAVLVVGLSRLVEELPDVLYRFNKSDSSRQNNQTLFLDEAALLETISTFSINHTTVETTQDEPAFWLYTSGTTGLPKGVIHKHISLCQTAELYGKGVLNINSEDIIYSTAKLYFAYGLGNALTFPLYCGATVVLNKNRPSPEVIRKTLKEEKPTLFFSVPGIYNYLLQDSHLNTDVLSSLRLCISAGEALPEHIVLKWQERFNLTILDGLGSTELLHIFMSNRVNDVKAGSSGSPVGGNKIRLLGSDGNDVPDGEIGDLVVLSKHQSIGYRNNDKAAKKSFRNGWVYTGDKYKKKGQHYFHCGRSDDLFKVNGQYISPNQIENCLLTHDGILECAVIGQEMKNSLTTICAYIVLKQGIHSSDQLADGIKQYVAQNLSKHKAPSDVVFIDTIPRTSTGKIQRFKLKNE